MVGSFHSKKSAFTLVEIMIVVAIIGLLASVATTSFVKAREIARRHACVRNLHEIDGAKQTWTLENHKRAGSPVDEAAVNSYLKSGAPVCPGGGSYTYGNIDSNPTCSVPGHSM
jgi:prepilin-type N-terminal cleavage/methylation domain-containing protein